MGAAFEQGRESIRAPATTIEDEPLAHDAVPEYRLAVELMLRRRDNERARLDRIEAKIAPIIGGTIVAFGLFIDKASTALDLAAGALYLVPLWMLLRIFETYTYRDVPDPNVLVQSWQRWPQTFLKSVFEGTADAIIKNAPTIDAKAEKLNTAMRCVFAVTFIVIGVRLFEALPNLPKGVFNAKGTQAVASAAPSAVSTGAGGAGTVPTAAATASSRGKFRPTHHP